MNSNQNQQQIGVLSTDISITLHTQHGLKIWTGRNRTENGKKRIVTISTPSILNILGHIHTHSANDDPYADDYLIKIEEKILKNRQLITEFTNSLVDQYVDILPPDIKLDRSFSVQPVEISLKIKSQIGYQLVYMISEYDNFARSIMTAAHIAIISRNDANSRLESATHLIRSLYGFIQRYKNAGITRDELINGTARALAVIERFGRLSDEIIQGTTRSNYAPINTKLLKQIEE